MKPRWSETEAQEFIDRYAGKGINADVALRTYTTRLLGSDPKQDYKDKVADVRLGRH